MWHGDLPQNQDTKACEKSPNKCKKKKKKKKKKKQKKTNMKQKHVFIYVTNIINKNLSFTNILYCMNGQTEI